MCLKGIGMNLPMIISEASGKITQIRDGRQEFGRDSQHHLGMKWEPFHPILFWEALRTPKKEHFIPGSHGKLPAGSLGKP